jgi:hypothetical protein
MKLAMMKWCTVALCGPAMAALAATHGIPEQSYVEAERVSTSAVIDVDRASGEVPLEEAEPPLPARPDPAREAKEPMPAPLSAPGHLATLLQAGATDCIIDVALADGLAVDEARRIESLWQAGERTAALQALEALDAAGALAGVGIQWNDPGEPAKTGDRGVDVRIGGTMNGAEITRLDYDAETDNLFAVIVWNGFFTVNRSATDGATWMETYRYVIGDPIPTMDAAVVDEYLYISYVDPTSARFSRMRRCAVASGAYDSVYGQRTLGDAGFGETMEEVAVTTNADEADDRVYLFLLTSTDEVQYHYASADGTIFYQSATNVTNAERGLDAMFAHFCIGHFLYVSYLGNDGDLYIMRRSDSNVWETRSVRDFTGYNGRTAICVWEDTIICAFEEQLTYDYGIRYVISYDQGDTWSFGTIAAPAEGESFYSMADVAARGGAGTAAVYQFNNGSNDQFFLRRREGYASGAWEDPVQINENVVQIDSWTTISWVPPTLTDPTTPYGYGMIYIASGDSAWFDREDGYVSSPGDNCDDPILIEASADLPYVAADTTCGRVDDYDDSCMGYYDNGEDTIYEFVVTRTMTVNITLDADANYAGVAVLDRCPDDPYAVCVAEALSSADPDVISDLLLDSGTYYIVVDTWPPPDCVDYTLEIEEVVCDVPCPPGSVAEGEACGTDTNGGCQMLPNPPAFESISSGDTVCGTIYQNGWRDTDWYEVQLTVPTALTFEVEAEFEIIVGLVEYMPGHEGSGDCDYSTGYLVPFQVGNPCELVTLETPVLEPGIWWLHIGPVLQQDIPCAEGNGYVATLSGGDPCPGDLNGDGQRNLADLGILLASYQVDDGGDIDGDGDTDLADLGSLLAVYDIPCP